MANCNQSVKLLDLPSVDKTLRKDDLLDFLHLMSSEHFVQP